MRSLPIAPLAPPSRRRLELAGESRDVDRAWRPVYAVWEITLACDLACRHCGSRAGKARPEELTSAEALDLVRQMAELGVKEVTLIGGEAYLRDDWLDIVRAVRAAGMSCTMTTGARGMTRERARGAQEAGVQSVSISIDGLRETHDHLRALAGSHDAAIAGLRHLREAGVKVAVNTQINRVNFHELEAVHALIAAERAHGWQVQFTVAMGRAADEPEILLEPWQVLDVIPRLAALAEKHHETGVRLWPGNNIGYFGPHETTLRGHYPRGHGGSCGAGRVTLGIEASGDIKGCPSLPTSDYVGGNVRDASLADIWERTAPLRFTRERSAADLWGYCAGCYYADECLAGCNWTTHVLFGKPGNNPYCHHRALEMKKAGKRERIVRKEAAPGVPFDFGRFEIVEEAWPEGEGDRRV